MKKFLCCLAVFLVLAAPSRRVCAINLRPDQEANFDGLNFLKVDQFDKAIEKFTLAIETAPKERTDSLAIYYTYRAWAYRKTKRFKEALADVDRAAVLNPNYDQAYSERATILNYLQRYSEAETDASKALLINPHLYVALNARGVAETALGRYDDALSDLTRALALKQDAVVYMNRGSLYYEQKLWTLALGDYETALQIKPDDSSALFWRALTYWQLKRYDAVISGTEGALKSDNTAMLRVLRGMAQQSKARWKEAVAEYDAALTKEPALPLAAALRELANRQLPIDFAETKKNDAPRAVQPPLPQAGEIRLQGVLKSVDKTQSRLVMETAAFTVPGGKTATLSPAKQKEVAWNPQTQILPFAGVERVGAIDEIKLGATIWVIGADKGAGTLLMARWLGSDQQLSEENALPATEPKLPTQAIGHPRFVKNDGKIWSAGTAFLVQWDEGDPVLLTAHHLLGPAGGLEKEIPPAEVAAQIKTVRFNDFLNRFLPGNGTQVMPLSPLSQVVPGDESGDMEAFRFTPEAGIEAGKELQTLTLAAGNPAVNEPLWLVGRAAGEKRPGNAGVLLYPARVVLSEAKRLVIQMKAPVPGRGFSGAPVVNAKGEVVGLMLSSSEWLDVNFFVCNPVSALRARLKG